MLTRQTPKRIEVDLGNGAIVVVTVGVSYSGPSVPKPKPKPGRLSKLVVYPGACEGGPAEELELSMDVEIVRG